MELALETPLMEFAQKFYFKTCHHNRRRLPGKAMQTEIRSMLRQVDRMLGRTSEVGDLKLSVLDALNKWYEPRFSKWKRKTAGDCFSALWRFAGELAILPTVNASPTRLPSGHYCHENVKWTLSEAEGTLWHLSLTRYFPTNVRIRTDKTIRLYRIAMKDFACFLGHDPTPADLTDDNVGGLMNMVARRGCAAATVNDKRARIQALWTWMAKRRIISCFPSGPRMHAPKRVPSAWTREELNRLFEACQDERGPSIGGVQANLWWTALHLVLWDTGARIGEVMALRWDWLNLKSGLLSVPAEVRKRQERDMVYQLAPETVEALQRMKEPVREIIFGFFPFPTVIHLKYRQLLKRAGLPHTRVDQFQKLRRSVASHVQAAGYDASVVLAHSSPEITRRSYLDPSIVGSIRPSNVLFRLGESGG